ncbi:hypothetical protein DPMN_147742, partial [Dreissena polymorpha]
MKLTEQRKHSTARKYDIDEVLREMEPYLPENGETIVIGPFIAISISFEQKQLLKQNCRDDFKVFVFSFTNWLHQFDLRKANELLSIINEIKERAATDGSMVMFCHDGFSRSGLVAVLWCLMERSKQDGYLAVEETVGQIRRRRQQLQLGSKRCRKRVAELLPTKNAT